MTNPTSADSTALSPDERELLFEVMRNHEFRTDVVTLEMTAMREAFLAGKRAALASRAEDSGAGTYAVRSHDPEDGGPMVWQIYPLNDDSHEATLCEFWSGEHDSESLAKRICAFLNRDEDSGAIRAQTAEALEIAAPQQYQCEKCDYFGTREEIDAHRCDDAHPQINDAETSRGSLGNARDAGMAEDSASPQPQAWMYRWKGTGESHIERGRWACPPECTEIPLYAHPQDTREKALHEALREFALETIDEGNGQRCLLCNQPWHNDDGECHAPNCLAAPVGPPDKASPSGIDTRGEKR